MLAFKAALVVAGAAYAVALPVDKRQASCTTASGAIRVVSAATDEILGYLAADLIQGQIVLTSSENHALTASVTCGYGPYLITVNNADPSSYPYLDALALYDPTLASGSPNWAFLTTSSQGNNAGNAWQDATGMSYSTQRQGIFDATGVGWSNVGLYWQNGAADNEIVSVSGWVRDDGNLVGLTGDLSQFLTAMSVEGQSFTAVNFQMVGNP